MKTITHSLQFVTELDENDSTAQYFLTLSKKTQVLMLEGMLKELLVPALEPVINELNEGNSWATLKVVK